MDGQRDGKSPAVELSEPKADGSATQDHAGGLPKPAERPLTDIQFAGELLRGDPFAELSELDYAKLAAYLDNHKPSKRDFEAVENTRHGHAQLGHVDFTILSTKISQYRSLKQLLDFNARLKTVQDSSLDPQQPITVRDFCNLLPGVLVYKTFMNWLAEDDENAPKYLSTRPRKYPYAGLRKFLLIRHPELEGKIPERPVSSSNLSTPGI